MITPYVLLVVLFFFFQAEDGIRDLVRSRGLGDVYKRQVMTRGRPTVRVPVLSNASARSEPAASRWAPPLIRTCLLYTSDAADERSSVDLGGRRIIKKKKTIHNNSLHQLDKTNNINRIYSNIIIIAIHNHQQQQQLSNLNDT
mgnify:CR=1 FL=1